MPRELPVSLMNARESPDCCGLLKYKVMVKPCPLLTISCLWAYLFVRWALVLAEGCQLMCVGVRAVKGEERDERATSNIIFPKTKLFAGQEHRFCSWKKLGLKQDSWYLDQ